jgi:NAD(P)-dependent dehydrogenase (short-subunit alcohol dehydrogenase family)
MQIENNTFLISGGGSGLGAATARLIVNQGGCVVVADIDEQRGGAVATELGRQAVFVKTDVADEASVRRCLDESSKHFAPIRGVVNCAGIAPGERVVGKGGPHALESFRRALEINLVGTFNVLRLAAHMMSTLAPLASGERGVMVNTASVAAFDGQIGQAAYSASKAGVAGMTLPIARELARFGIRVMTIAPGIFETPILQAMTDEVRGSLAEQIPFPARFGRPEEFAALVRHIVENEYLNGEVVRLDGAVRMGAR